jgi:hypothetical protein
MTTTIWFEDKFGEQRTAGLNLRTSEIEGELYELLALKDDIVDDPSNLGQLEGLLNVDSREGYAIYPVKNDYNQYVYFDFPNRLVLCLARGLWG